ncbi:hypothetical protein GQ43DRAFT_445494 [Delitschia confertaspora ATCC 74209]|uniref:Uncharacterized protein n=1 Tax=Delitschia confertaspora ATCC 74209 TaxID=1513339 RepID=A0A9P4JB46_9PLEO|nr:hypothetical protein GQ43DRAFT_445494 [Delitschia confertaspora ATCC 74209]
MNTLVSEITIDNIMDCDTRQFDIPHLRGPAQNPYPNRPSFTPSSFAPGQPIPPPLSTLEQLPFSISARASIYSSIIPITLTSSRTVSTTSSS